MRIDAPVEVVFRFYTWLDHLRFTTPSRRQEWCPDLGMRIEPGAEYDVCIKQGRHELTLRFRTVRYEHDRFYEDEFLSWPVKGARHLQSFESSDDCTYVTDANIWTPPWYARALVHKNVDEQSAFFEERLTNAKRVIEAVFEQKGEDAFESGVFRDAEDAGIDPLISEDS